MLDELNPNANDKYSPSELEAAIQAHEEWEATRRVMSFHLRIKLPSVEIKKSKITIEDFFSLYSGDANDLEEDVFKKVFHVNLNELNPTSSDQLSFFVDEIILDGEIISSFIRIESFIEELKQISKKYESEWEGQFYGMFSDGLYVYSAPKFEPERYDEEKYWEKYPEEYWDN
jgi:hypothetical protein